MCTEPSIKADEPVGRLEGPDDRQPGGLGGLGEAQHAKASEAAVSKSPPILKCILSASSESWCVVYPWSSCRISERSYSATSRR